VPVVPKAEAKNRYIFPTTATQHLPTVADVRDYIQNLNVASVELHEEHVESLLELMVFDGTVEKVLVQHDFTGGASGGQSNGRSNDRKRKQRPVNSSDSDSDAGTRRKSRKTGAANGKARRKFGKLSRAGESDDESESSESDFDSDEDVEARKKRKADAGEDDDEGKKSKRRRKKRVVRKAGSDDDGDDSDASMSGSDSDAGAGAGKAKPKKANGADRSALDGKTDYVYRLVRPWVPVIGWTDMPCGACPAEAFCTEPTRPLGQHHFGVGGPKIGIQLEVGMQGVGMMGGAGAAIGVSNAKWGEAKGAVGFGVAPVNPRDCHYFRDWLAF